MADYRLKQMESLIKEFDEQLSDKEKLFRLLNAPLGMHPETEKWTKSDSFRSIDQFCKSSDHDRWTALFVRASRIIGADEVASLLIKKGLVNYVISESVGRRRGEFEYKVK